MIKTKANPMNRIHILKISLILFLSIFVLITSKWMTGFMIASSLSYIALVTGFIFKKNPKIHVPLMNFGILSDLSVVLILQYQRQAVQTAVSFSLNPLQQLHILVSLIAVILYIPLLILGWKRFLNKQYSSTFKKFHINLGPWALLFRSLGFALMFSMLAKN